MMGIREFISSKLDDFLGEDNGFAEAFERAFLQHNADDGREDVIGPMATTLSDATLHEIGARIAREGTLIVARDNGTFTKLKDGNPVSAICNGQMELPDHNGPIWADMTGRTLLKLPDDLSTEHIHYVVASRTQQYDGRDWDRDDDLKYIGSHMEVVTVPDEYVDSIIEYGALDYGKTGGGNNWFSNPHNRRYDENGKRTDFGFGAWDGEIALLYSVHPNGIGVWPPEVDKIRDAEHGFVKVSGADLSKTGDSCVYASTIIPEHNLREAIETAEATITKSLEIASEKAKASDVNLELLSDTKTAEDDYADNFGVQ